MSKHAGICMNIPNACLLISRCSHGKILNTCFNEDYSLKEHEAVFLKRQNLIFSVVAGNIWFAFHKIKCDLSYLFRGVLRQNERRCAVWAPKLGLGTKPTFDALLLAMKLQCFVVFVYYQGSSHIPSCFMVLAKHTENNLAFGVEVAKDHESW